MPATTDPAKRERVIEYVLDQIASGRSARKIFEDAQCEGIFRETFLGWCVDDPKLATKYARAMAIRIEGKMLDMEEIADDGRNDFIETEQGTKYNAEAVARSKLRLEQRRWEAEKLVPKKYGHRVETTHQIGESFDKIVREVVDPK